jgi:hypothetical protein
MTIATACMGSCPTCGHETFPPEPPVDSIVLDNDGDAWQRKLDSDAPDGWACIVHSSDYEGRDWKDLVQNWGPITVVYLPEESV